MTKLDIPKGCREEFRAAVMMELGDCAKELAAEYVRYSNQRMYGLPADLPECVDIGPDSEYLSSMRYLGATAEVMCRLEGCNDAQEGWQWGGELSVEGDPEVLYHVLHLMAAKVCEPMIGAAVAGLPLDREKVDVWTDRMGWALEQMSSIQQAMEAEDLARKAVAA